MSVTHLSYVMCDSCAVPASDPVGSAKEARAMIPLSWSRVTIEHTGKMGDLCPKCK